MNKERIEQIARECGIPSTEGFIAVSHRFAKAIRNEALVKTAEQVCYGDESITGLRIALAALNAEGKP